MSVAIPVVIMQMFQTVGIFLLEKSYTGKYLVNLPYSGKRNKACCLLCSASVRGNCSVHIIANPLLIAFYVGDGEAKRTKQPVHKVDTLSRRISYYKTNFQNSKSPIF